MYYIQEDGSRIDIYYSTGVIAEPALEPIQITIASVILDPVPTYTASDVSLKVRLDAKRSDVFSSGSYVMLGF